MAEKYEEIVKKIPVPERAIGPLAGLATRLDFLGPKVEELESTLSPQVANLAEKVGKLEYALRTVAFPEGVVMPEVKIEQISFAYTLAANQGVLLTEEPPFAGYIKQVTIHWPEGCAALVDVRVGHGTRQFCPKEPDFLALNDATPTFPFNEWVRGDEKIWVEMRNTDSAQPHSITVTMILSGAE